MISVTEEAKKLFSSVEHPEGTVLRLDPAIDQDTGETHVGLSAGEPRRDDQIVEHHGEVLLHIHPTVSEELDGSTLNLVETPDGTGIGLLTPETGANTDGS